ncbi:MAG: hybrid sensor histidine kinase/response regulator [Hahellaceae bacterium]|nr:hybrid sensor histidine kinase/response regulator [Hahellaceae bacterium]
MIEIWQLLLFSLLYIALLFGLAWVGDRHPGLYQKRWARPQIYSLSIAIYFTSWTFYGAVGRASNEGLGFFSIYLGPLMAFFFFGPLMEKIIVISKKQGTTSIADFIASRYGKSQLLASLVTLIAIIGVIPYIALQLKAVSLGVDVLTHPAVQSGVPLPPPDFDKPVWLDTSFWIALVMALFGIFFGTRHLDVTEHHQGLMQAVAFESIVKLVAFCCVGLFVCYEMFDGFDDIFTRINHQAGLEQFSLAHVDGTSFVIQTIVAMLAMLCLPRQIHVTVVENHQVQDFQVARVMMPLFILIASAFVLPIAGAGWLIFGDSVDADTLVLRLPLYADKEWLGMLAFMGGSSAATAMVIVSSVALSTMFCNEIIVPLLFRFFRAPLERWPQLSLMILSIRRLTIVLLLLIAYGFYRQTASTYSLTAFGLLSFVAVAQFAPALIGGVLWRRGTYYGAASGLTGGFAVWLYLLVLPTLTGVPEGLRLTGLPSALNTPGSLDIVTLGTLWSLGINLALYIGVSLLSKQSVREKIQVASFFQDNSDFTTSKMRHLAGLATVDDLFALSERFLGEEKSRAIFSLYQATYLEPVTRGRHASARLIKFVEKQLASRIGSSSARAVLDSTLRGRDLGLEDVVSIVDEASQVMQFNRDLLQSALENISLGVSVIDNQQRIVAWNQRYLHLFNYPPDFVRVGRPLEDLVRYNLDATHLPNEIINTLVEQRMTLIRSGTAHEYEREKPDGTVLLIQGNPTPGGGFVTTFADITALRKATQALSETNTYLEQRVAARTAELSVLNEQLLAAKKQAEQANQSKTRFLASASHDLLQPINAAKLFTSALQGLIQAQPTLQPLTENIDQSLTAAEELLTTLLDISKLDAGVLEPKIQAFRLAEILSPLINEFKLSAQEKNLELHWICTKVVIESDPKMLRRILQNLISNALRYTQQGRILVGCRRIGHFVKLQVIDTGIGIPEHELGHIFEEFRRIRQSGAPIKGMGLGLAIVDRICMVLNHPIEVHSTVGKGSCFSLTLPLASVEACSRVTQTTIPEIPRHTLMPALSLNVLCLDNDAGILEGMVTLLKGWGCKVTACSNREETLNAYKDKMPDVVIADFQLDNGDNGLDVLNTLRTQFSPARFRALLVTANTDSDIRQQALNLGYQYLRKPLKPAALRAIMNTFKSG